MKKISLFISLVSFSILSYAQTTIFLNTSDNWFDTEYDCVANDEIRFIAFGAHADNPDNDNWIYGPGGSINLASGSVPVEGIPDNALIGKIGTNGESFYIGSGGKFNPESSGRLYIKVNDGNLSNNVGNLILKIFGTPLKTYLLNTTDNWASTDLNLEYNHEYYIYATGSHADNPDNDNWILSPSGSINLASGSVPVEGLPDNCLIGRIDNSGEIFYIGNGGKFTPSISGTLQLMVNDGNLSNNVGYIITQIYDNESSTSSVSFLNSNYSISVFPNPANNNLTIDVEQKLNEFSIELFDLSGKQITKKISSKNIYNLSLNDLTNGTYILKLKNESNELIRVEKIIKQ